MAHSLLILAIGFLAQAFFAARILVQWLLSERARHVLSPSLFWIFSLAGSYLFCVYGWMRHDFAIVLGQFISYYIYLWNLDSKGVLRRVVLPLRALLLLTPVVAICFVAGHAAAFVTEFLHNGDVPLWLLLFGSAGQVLFTLRFIYQWFYSRHKGESSLPAGFWLISLAGSLSIVSYGVIRHDVVLMVGQSFGLVAYVRNLVLIMNERRGARK
ncbi:MAG: lipid-A-disaccharide synthase N-terminal domain-containing protein [Prevotellaceae bacterium]|nr:lipid-A-disaccharide synthase N-terminal domain-containing protein [Prevotellaceae bacterium]